MASKRFAQAIGEEMSGVALGDARLERRATVVVEALAKRPKASLPEAMRGEAALEATYRLLRNEAVKASALLAPHQRQSVARGGRAASSGLPLIATHDTTEATFGGEYRRKGLGLLPNGTQGFFGHVSLLVARDGEVRDPLGVLRVQTYARLSRKGKRSGHAIAKERDSEGLRWLSGMRETEDMLGGPGAVIHVADREADAYWLLAGLDQRGSRFVIRNKYDRRTIDEDGETRLLREAVRGGRTIQLTRTVQLAARHPGERNTTSRRGADALKGASYVRTPQAKKTHPSRAERLATLQVTVARHTLRRPNSESADLPESMAVNVVRVFEPAPPQGEAPIEWFLLTNEPVDTEEQVAAVIDAYRTRWLIEEFFKALKTGCNYEKHQLESLDSLVNLLSLLCPIAWRMLRMRALSRMSGETPASNVLTDAQLLLLCAEYPALKKKQLSVQDALLAVAALGGHIKNNGPPGWLVIGRGLHLLMEREVGFFHAHALLG